MSSYQWYRHDPSDDSETDISGATGSTYTQTPDDVGKIIKVRATIGDETRVSPDTGPYADTETVASSVSTGGGGSGSGSGSLWDEFVAIRDALVPSYLTVTPDKIKEVSTPAAALAAINGIQAGQSVRLTTPNMIIPGRILLPNLASMAEVQCNGAKFTGVDNSQALSQGRWDTIFAGHAANVRMYDGVIPQSANAGIRLYGDCSHIEFYRFTIYGTNGQGLLWQPIYGNVNNCYFTGEIFNCGVQWWVTQFDPHPEKGTGTHGIYLGGASGGQLNGLKIAAYIHDQHFGAALEQNLSYGGEFSVYADTLTFVALQQVAANVIQAWGSNGTNTFPLLYGTNLQGRVMDCNTPSPDSAYSGFTVTKARAHNTNQNPHLSSTEGNVSTSEPFDSRRGVVYLDKATI